MASGAIADARLTELQGLHGLVTVTGMVERWEHTVMYVTEKAGVQGWANQAAQRLGEIGMEGWQLVAVQPPVTPGSVTTLWLKRPFDERRRSRILAGE